MDYAGQTVAIIDRLTGEVKDAQIFVAVLGASNYTYAEAPWSQSLPDWIGSHVRALTFFGGCPSGTSITLDTTVLHYSNLTLRASFHHTPRTIRRALEFIEKGVIRAKDFVNGDCLLDDLPALFKSMAAGNHAVKTLIRVRD